MASVAASPNLRSRAFPKISRARAPASRQSARSRYPVRVRDTLKASASRSSASPRFVLSLQDLGRNHHSPCIPSRVLVAMSSLGCRGCRPSGIPFSKPALLRRSSPAHEVLRPSGLGDRLPQRILPDATWVNSEEDFSGSMHSGSYFTNLMSNDCTYLGQGGGTQSENREMPAYEGVVQPDDIPPSDGPPAIEEVHAAAKEKRRSKNFSVEDKLLVSTWLNVSQDPIQGVDQSYSTYWGRIHQYFHGNRNFDSDRSQVSLMNRWSGIQHDVNVFCGCVSRIEARNQSGASIDDKIANACALFISDDKHHRNFSYMHCWKILKDQPKWLERCRHMNAPKPPAKKQKTTGKSIPSSAPVAVTPAAGGDGETTQGAQERPPGKKKEKQMLRQRAGMEAMEYLVAEKEEADAAKELKKEERFKKAFALQEERIRIERERVEFKREMEEERIMNIDMSTLSYKQQQYYERWQDEIIAKRMNN